MDCVILGSMNARPPLGRRAGNALLRLGYMGLIEPFLLQAKRRVCAVVLELRARTHLEVGCGACTQAVALARHGVSVTAVDISDRLFPPWVRRRPATLNYFRADGRSLPFSDGLFDVAFASMALHEMPPGNRIPVLAEMTRLVRPGGTILIMDYHFEPAAGPSPAATIIRLIEWLAGREHNGNFRDFVARGGIPALARQRGLAVRRRHPILADRGGIFELPVSVRRGTGARHV
jgi:SAM-dependent methyltransferase